MILTARDCDLLETLTRRVRLMTVAQVATVWWPRRGRRAGALQRRLEQLIEVRMIERHVINAHPLLPLESPLFTWTPGIDDPDYESLSLRCCERRRPAVPQWVVVATPAAASLYGSTACGLPAAEHRNHDLRLSAVYGHYRLRDPHLAALWIGEHALPKQGYRLKDPDAFLRTTDGQVLRVIESAGRYAPEQVESFHEHCLEFDLPYELW